MYYVDLAYCEANLFDLAIASDQSEQTDHYDTYPLGIQKLEGVLEKVQWDYYEGFYKKASFLFVSINKGHFFTNGNKRLALVLLLDFAYMNKRIHINVPESKYIEWFQSEFPQYEMSRNEFQRVYGWGFYNLNKAVASSELHGYSYDQLKEKVESFLRTFLRPLKGEE